METVSPSTSNSRRDMASFRPSHPALQAPHPAAPTSKYTACRGFTVYVYVSRKTGLQS